MLDAFSDHLLLGSVLPISLSRGNQSKGVNLRGSGIQFYVQLYSQGHNASELHARSKPASDLYVDTLVLLCSGISGISLVPRPERGRRKGPGFHCLCMRLLSVTAPF